MIIRRNLIRGIGASLIGLSTHNILKPAKAAKSYIIEEENKLKWHILSNLDLETIEYGDWLNHNIDNTKKDTLKSFDES